MISHTYFQKLNLTIKHANFVLAFSNKSKKVVPLFKPRLCLRWMYKVYQLWLTYIVFGKNIRFQNLNIYKVSWYLIWSVEKSCTLSCSTFLVEGELFLEILFPLSDNFIQFFNCEQKTMTLWSFRADHGQLLNAK